MKIPKQLKIGGLIFQVSESEEIANQSNVWGSTHFKKQKIFLDPSETQQKKEHTLLHEILHACLWTCGIGDRLRRFDKDLEEDLVASLDSQLYQVFKDNNLFRS
jgi:Zn-dependent peptidase ImmA (M78 family)